MSKSKVKTFLNKLIDDILGPQGKNDLRYLITILFVLLVQLPWLGMQSIFEKLDRLLRPKSKNTYVGFGTKRPISPPPQDTKKD